MPVVLRACQRAVSSSHHGLQDEARGILMNEGWVKSGRQQYCLPVYCTCCINDARPARLAGVHRGFYYSLSLSRSMRGQ